MEKYQLASIPCSLLIESILQDSPLDTTDLLGSELRLDNSQLECMQQQSLTLSLCEHQRLICLYIKISHWKIGHLKDEMKFWGSNDN